MDALDGAETAFDATGFLAKLGGMVFDKGLDLAVYTGKAAIDEKYGVEEPERAAEPPGARAPAPPPTRAPDPPAKEASMAGPVTPSSGIAGVAWSTVAIVGAAVVVIGGGLIAAASSVFGGKKE